MVINRKDAGIAEKEREKIQRQRYLDLEDIKTCVVQVVVGPFSMVVKYLKKVLNTDQV